MAGYRWLHKGSGHLPKLGESFFTKLLYAAGYGYGAGVWPLMLDSRVRAALRTLGFPINFTPQAYGQYLQYTHEWAAEWSVSPEQVEFALFNHAGRTTLESDDAAPTATLTPTQ